MKKSTTVAVFALAVIASLATGCGKSKALQAAEEFEKSACACKDSACATEATKKFGEAAKDMGTASSGEADAISKATTDGTACVTKLAMAAAGAAGAAAGAKK